MLDARLSGRGLLVVGDVVTDVLALHGHSGPGKGTHGDGAPAGETDTPAHITLRPGGSGANTAAWAASLGTDVRMLARVGRDSGSWHRACLADAGVRPCLRIDPERPTAVIVVMVDPAGERTMVTDRGAGAFLGPDDWDDALLDGVAHVHVSGYTLFTETGAQLAGLVMSTARRCGVTISVDPASTGFLRAFGPRRFLEATAGAGTVLPNRDEARLLAGTTDPGAAAVELAGVYGRAVVKLGREGAVAARRGGKPMWEAGAPVRAIDSTGAGDAFAAGFLTACLGGAGDREAVAAGCRTGARAVSRIGGRPGTPPAAGGSGPSAGR
ncbi:MAG TPA: sugar kinase [Actinomadura sp.]|jgi:sugar/nucleoside kinase (ribokinase family)|nr:sugar kinase [Actinomadura sp.]